MKFIYSHGGYAREFARNVRVQYPDEQVYFVDDTPTGEAISYAAAREIAQGEDAAFIIGFANSALRERKTKTVISDGFPLFECRAETAIIGDNVVIGAGSVLSDFSIITSDTTIGQSFHCNVYGSVTHDCLLGNFVTLAPRATILGRVIIEDHVYVGTGATILPGSIARPLRIGKGAIIGAHALVTKDVAANTTVIGAPARVLER